MKKNIGIVLFLLVCATSVTAKINYRKSKNVEKAPNFWYNPMKLSDTKILAFNESQNVFIDRGEIMFQRINKWNDFDNYITIPFENAYFDSHMLYFKKSETKERVKIVAEVEFDNPIIGFVADGYLFNKGKQALFAPNPTHTLPAEKVNIWSLEEEESWTPLDKVTMLSPTRIRIEITNQSAADPLRVITIK